MGAVPVVVGTLESEVTRGLRRIADWRGVTFGNDPDGRIVSARHCASADPISGTDQRPRRPLRSALARLGSTPFGIGICGPPRARRRARTASLVPCGQSLAHAPSEVLGLGGLDGLVEALERHLVLAIAHVDGGDRHAGSQLVKPRRGVCRLCAWRRVRPPRATRCRRLRHPGRPRPWTSRRQLRVRPRTASRVAATARSRVIRRGFRPSARTSASRSAASAQRARGLRPS